jgi:hypothetical protein
MKIAQKPRGTARFRGHDAVSVCEIRAWKRRFGPLSPRAIFGVLFSWNVPTHVRAIRFLRVVHVVAQFMNHEPGVRHGEWRAGAPRHANRP